MAMVEKDVVIVGAGIAGLATAVALKRIGVEALVLERSDDLRTTGAALGLFPNAWRALAAVGVAHKLSPLYKPIENGSVTNVSTGDTKEMVLPSAAKGDDREQVGVRAVHRKVLLEALAQELPKDWIRFSSRLSSIETKEEGGASVPIVHLEDGTTIKSKALIGCDGVNSVVARWLGLSEPVHSGRSAVRGLSTFPDGHEFKQDFRQFIEVDKRAGVISLNDKEVYWFFVCQSPPQEKKLETNPELIQRELLEHYAKNFPLTFLDVLHHANLPTLSWAPLILRSPWRIIFGNLRKGNVTVAGDAMHPMTPDLGQGGCIALEDAVVLARHIGDSFIRNGKLVAGEMPGVMDRYIKERKWRVSLVVTCSYFSGWSQHVGSSPWMKFLRDTFFYKYIFAKLLSIADFDCGKLPTVSQTELDHLSKED